MTFQSGTINPLSTSPATDVPKIKNDLAVLRGVIGGTPDTDVPSVWLPRSGGTLTGAVNEAAGASIASAATPNIASATGNYIQITGTTTITGFTTGTAGTERELRFAGALTLTNSASLILLGGANISTAAGDIARFRCEGGTVWRCVSYQRAEGTPLVVPGPKMQFVTAVPTTSGAAIVLSGIPSWARKISILLNNVSANAANALIVQLGSGSVQTTGYSSASTAVSVGVVTATNFVVASVGLAIFPPGAAYAMTGIMTLVNIGGNTWVEEHVASGLVSGTHSAQGSGVVTLGGVLDRICLTTLTGTDAFDAGSVALLIEGY